jgi:hypothetical protein
MTDTNLTSIYDAIGRVAVEGAWLEHGLVQLLWALTDEVAFVAYANGSLAGELITMCKTAIDASSNLSEETRKVAEDLLSQANTLKDERNSVIHARWLGLPRESGEGIEWVGLKPIRRKAFSDKDVKYRNPEEIRQLAAQLHILVYDIKRLSSHIHFERSDRRRNLQSFRLNVDIQTPHGYERVHQDFRPIRARVADQ